MDVIPLRHQFGGWAWDSLSHLKKLTNVFSRQTISGELRSKEVFKGILGRDDGATTEVLEDERLIAHQQILNPDLWDLKIVVVDRTPIEDEIESDEVFEEETKFKMTVVSGLSKEQARASIADWNNGYPLVDIIMEYQPVTASRRPVQEDLAKDSKPAPLTN